MPRADFDATMMHAHDWQGHDVRGWHVTEKLDGCRARWTGRALLSRGGHPIAAPGLPNVGKRSALDAAGLSTSEAHRCEQLARVPEAAFESYIAVKSAEGKAVTADEVSRMVVKRERKDAVVTLAEVATVKTADLSALSSRGMKFGTVLADPPWLYGNQSTRGATGDHYTGMTVDEIAALRIAA